MTTPTVSRKHHSATKIEIRSTQGEFVQSFALPADWPDLETKPATLEAALALPDFVQRDPRRFVVLVTGPDGTTLLGTVKELVADQLTDGACPPITRFSVLWSA